VPAPTSRALQVALPLPLPQAFDYMAPDGPAPADDWVGRRVRVPFGKGEQVGLVLGVAPPQPDGPALRTALSLLDDAPLLDAELLATLAFCARYYHAPVGEVLALALPAGLRDGQPLPETRGQAWRLTEAGATALAGLREGAPRRLAERLAAGPVPEAELALDGGDWRAAARRLAERGLAAREPGAAGALRPPPDDPGAPSPTATQQAALDALRAGTGYRALLLEGVTGSGKTEVYLQAIRDCLASGRQALVLVPEIGLTPQTLQRFRDRLRVPVLASHSGLADGERSRAWLAMARGEAGVLVGTRSAVFTPLPHAGLIVVDEEHDGSYKQQDGVRYHARDVALVRGKSLGVPVLLGSATPSLESLHLGLRGRAHVLRLPQRPGTARAPRVRVLDVRKRPLDGGLAQEAVDAIAACVARGEQALVFRNRRGYAPTLLCHDCGWSAQCKRCDSALSLHAGGRRLLCHHCGARAPRPLACPDCASLALQAQGVGTERVEETLVARLPAGTRVVRVDRETTQRRGELERKLREFGDAAGVLVGTQMLAKGHDLPRLTLVVVVGVDEGLYSADFRANERLAQLLVQVAGRAGRAALPGEVLLQTHHPGHPLLATLLAGGYPAVAALALAEREAAGFPPYAHLAMLRAEAPREAEVGAFLDAAHALFGQHPGVVATAPMPAPMARRAGRARGQLLLSAAQRPALQAALDAWVPALYAEKSARKVRWSLDVDPMDLY
jgi:primosomal protein N' (replication factor Y)